jgi:hypothetical protein
VTLSKTKLAREMLEHAASQLDATAERLLREYLRTSRPPPPKEKP